MNFRQPMTTWPGQAAPGMFLPPGPFFGTTHNSPLFGGADAIPQFTGPFNAGNPMMQMAMMQLLPLIMQGTGREAYQFFPTQNVYDQMVARNYYTNQQRAFQAAGARDQAQLAATLAGAQQLILGRSLNAAERAQATNAAGMMNNLTPALTQFLGPDLVDQFYGRRGSSQLLASQIFAAGRTMQDPFTGQFGMNPNAARTLSEEMFARFYTREQDFSRMMGVSAGQAGTLANELQSRGLLGEIGRLGPESIAAMRSRGSSFYDDAFIARAVERDSEITRMRAAGQTPTAADFSAARNRIAGTRDQILGGAGISASDIMGMPGGEDMLRASDAQALGERLRGMSRVVRVMRDIFGDMGNPNAPMREIINGLQNLTQGGLTGLDPVALETIVRRTHVIGRQTGVGMQGMIGMMAQAASVADRHGVNRLLIPELTQRAALFGAAARDTQNLSTPAWGSLSLDQLTLADQNLRVLAAGSPAANSLNALLRMSESGLLAGGDGTETAAILAAIRGGQTTYSFGGQTRSLQLSRQDVRRMVSRDFGINNAALTAILDDVSGNQQYGAQTANIVRTLQANDAGMMLAGAFARPLTGALQQASGMTALGAVIPGLTAGDASAIATDVSRAMASDYWSMDSATARDPARLRAAQEQSLRRAITATIRTRNPGATDAQIDQVIAGMGGLQAMAVGMQAEGNMAFSGTAAGSMLGAHQLYNRQTVAATTGHWRAAEATRLQQTAMAGLGTAGPIARAVDALANARPGDSIRTILADVLGGLPIDDIISRDPNGPVAAMLGLVQQNQTLDPRNDEDFATINRNAAIMRGLVEGGDVADAAYQQFQNAPGLSASVLEALRAAAQGGGIAAMMPASAQGEPQADPQAVATALANSYGSSTGRDALRAARGDLARALSSGNRANTVNAALNARRTLAEKAIAEGVFADLAGPGRAAPQSIADLSPEEIERGVRIMSERAAAGVYQGESGRGVHDALRDAALLEGIGRGDGAGLPDALRRINALPGDPTVAAAGTPREITLAGTLEITADNRARLQARGNPRDAVDQVT